MKKIIEVTIILSYEQEKNEFKCKPNESLFNVLLAFASKKCLNFEELSFLYDGKALNKSDFNKPISQFITKINEGIVTILVYHNPNILSEERNLLNLNVKAKSYFWLDSRPTEISCSMKSKMIDISRAFSNEIGIDINLLSFKYQNKDLDFQKNFYEIANEMDKNRKRMDIFVQNKDSINNENKQENNIVNKKDEDNICKKYKALIIIIIILLILLIIIVIFVVLYFTVLKKDDDDNNSTTINSADSLDETQKIIETYKIISTNKIIETNKIISTDGIIGMDTNKIIETDKSEKTDTNIIIKTDEVKKTEIIVTTKCNDRCNLCDSNNLDNCLSCKEDFDLIEGECIPYTFYIIYNVTRYYEEITLFNYRRLNDIYALKIEDNIINPNIVYTFPDRRKYTVYYYFQEKTVISLTSMFESVSKIIDFSFNNKYLNNFYIKDMKRMFALCPTLTKLTIDFTNINAIYLKEIDNLFYSVQSLITINLINLNENNLANMSKIFYNCQNLKEVNFHNFNTEKVVNMSYMFYYVYNLEYLDLSSFKTSKVSDMRSMFYLCYKLESLYISNFDTKNVINMREMFSQCRALTSLNTKIFNTEIVTDISYMFYNCEGLTSLDLSKMNTQKVTDMDSIFNQCVSLQYLNIDNFNTENVISMQYMFNVCSSLTSLNLKNFDTKNVKYFRRMFGRCRSLTSIDISNFKPENIQSANKMFYDCNNLKYIDISNLIFNSYTNLFSYIPEGCTLKINKRSDTKILSYPKNCNIIWVD